MSLPSGLSEPLHLLEPMPWGRWLLAALAVAAALWLFRRLVQRHLLSRAFTAEIPVAAPEPAAASASTFAREVDALVQEAIAERRYREGCHRLAELLRRRLAATAPGASAESLTVGEMRRDWGASRATRTFERLAEHQFGRRRPGRADLLDAGRRVTSAGESPQQALRPATRRGRRGSGSGSSR